MGFQKVVLNGGTRITNWSYADDTTLICRSKEELMDLLNPVKTVFLSSPLQKNVSGQRLDC